MNIKQRFGAVRSTAFAAVMYPGCVVFGMATCHALTVHACVQAESAGTSSTAAQPSRFRAQEEEEESEPEGSEVSYDSDEPPKHEQSDADSDGECSSFGMY